MYNTLFSDSLGDRSRIFFVPRADRNYSDEWWNSQLNAIRGIGVTEFYGETMNAVKYDSVMKWLTEETPLLRHKADVLIINGRVLLLDDLQADGDFALLDTYEYSVRNVKVLESIIKDSDKLVSTLSYLGCRKLGKLVDGPFTVVHHVASHQKAYGPGHRYGISGAKTAGGEAYANALSMLTQDPSNWSVKKFLNAHTLIMSSYCGVANEYASTKGGVRIDRLDTVLRGESTKIGLGLNDLASLHVQFAVNPLSHPAQRISAFVAALRSLFKEHLLVTGYLLPKASSDLPLKNFYRYVVDLTTADPRAAFSYLPPKTLFSTSIHVPDMWFVRAADAIYDMDNLKMEGVVGDVHASYSLIDFVVAGAAIETNPRSKQGPSGLGLVLSTPNLQVSDSLVMANLGYYQLRAPGPGIYTLRIREGRALDLEKLNEEVWIFIFCFIG